MRFTGTYREDGWRRCAAMAAGDGLVFTPWPHPTMPGWSLPALEAAKAVAEQGAALFEPFHLALYAAYFTESRDIADPAEVARLAAAAGADMDRFADALGSGRARAAVVRDWEAALTEHGVRSIPTVIVETTGQALVGLAPAATYLAAVEDAAG